MAEETKTNTETQTTSSTSKEPWYKQYIKSIQEDAVIPEYYEVEFVDPDSGKTFKKQIRKFDDPEIMERILEEQVQGFLSRVKLGIV